MTKDQGREYIFTAMVFGLAYLLAGPIGVGCALLVYLVKG